VKISIQKEKKIGFEKRKIKLVLINISASVLNSEKVYQNLSKNNT